MLYLSVVTLGLNTLGEKGARHHFLLTQQELFHLDADQRVIA
jgi:hypothetical protein